MLQSFIVSGCAHLFCCQSPVIRARLFQFDYFCIFFVSVGTHQITAFFSPSFHPYWTQSTTLIVLYSLVACPYVIYQRFFLFCFFFFFFLFFLKKCKNKQRELQLQQELKKSVCGGTGAFMRATVFFFMLVLIFVPLYYDIYQ